MKFIRPLAGGLAFLVLAVALSTLLPQPTAAVQTTAPVQPIVPAQTPTTTAAPPKPDIAAFEATWRSWMVRHAISQSSMAIGQSGEIIGTADAGRAADTAYPVASLSKAVTAMCMNTLLQQTPYDWNTPISGLAAVWEALGMAPHPELAKLPLSALVTHTSGLPKNIDEDETAGEGRNLYTQAHFARAALRDPAHMSTDRSHSYSNVNFALLGQIIEGITGRPYGDYCAEITMAPAGATAAQVGGRMWATAGFGGWSVSATDYARFLMHWYAPDRPWMQNPSAFPLDRNSGAGLGVFNRRVEGQHMLNHAGLWRSKTPERQIGALFVVSGTGAVIVANWQGALPPEAYSDLRESITAALH